MATLPSFPIRSDFPDYVRDEIYSDFILDFSKNPVTGYLGEVVNERAITQMLQCLVLTEQGEWPFEPYNGSLVSRMLFEPNDNFATALLSDAINSALRNYAPQVSVVGLQVHRDPGDPADAILIQLFFQIQNVPGTFTVTLPILRRIR